MSLLPTICKDTTFCGSSYLCDENMFCSALVVYIFANKVDMEIPCKKVMP